MGRGKESETNRGWAPRVEDLARKCLLPWVAGGLRWRAVPWCLGSRGVKTWILLFCCVLEATRRVVVGHTHKNKNEAAIAAAGLCLTPPTTGHAPLLPASAAATNVQ